MSGLPHNSSPVRVAMLNDAWFPFWGGGQVHVKNLSYYLKTKHHYHIDLFYPQKTNLIYRFSWTFYVLIPLMVRHWQNPYQLVHSHGFNSGISAKLFSLISGVPCVHTVHGSHLMDQQKNGLKSWLERYLLTRVHYQTQITVSRKFLDYPNVNRRIIVISNGVSIASFDRVTCPKNSRPTLIFVGRDHPDKGFNVLSQAMILIKPDFPDIKLIQVHNGNYTGRRLIKAYKSAHIFVLPSLAEGQPISLLEAWAARLPVVVTATGENPYMVKSGTNGYLVPPKDSQALAHAIKHLLSHPRLATKLGLAGYKLVKTRYTWEHVAKLTHDVYQQVLKFSGRSVKAKTFKPQT